MPARPTLPAARQHWAGGMPCSPPGTGCGLGACCAGPACLNQRVWADRRGHSPRTTPDSLNICRATNTPGRFAAYSAGIWSGAIPCTLAHSQPVSRMCGAGPSPSSTCTAATAHSTGVWSRGAARRRVPRTRGAFHGRVELGYGSRCSQAIPYVYFVRMFRDRLPWGCPQSDTRLVGRLQAAQTHAAPEDAPA